MAEGSLCVACAQLPVKDRSIALTRRRCPECKTEFGVTSYGTAFRFTPRKAGRIFTPFVMGGLAVGAGLLTAMLTLVGLGVLSSDVVAPSAPVTRGPLPDDLLDIREVAVADAIPQSTRPAVAKQTIASLINKIKRTNDAEGNRDAFVLAQMKERPELRGLPFVMGDACRLDVNRAQSFESHVQAVREGLDQESRQSRGSHADEHVAFWTAYNARSGGNGIQTQPGIAALTQILGPESAPVRLSLVRKLGESPNPDATRALTRAVLFDTSSEVRVAALKELKHRPKDKAQDEVFLHGIRYPLAIVAIRAGNAIAELDRKDLLPKLAEFLDQPTPGDPEKRVVENREVCEVREVVKINHHRNCLLCHPPSATGQPQEVPGVIPIPGTPFPSSPKDAYGSALSMGEPMVRADTTYLRQDFSLLMPVENASPWPAMQRFDFLVRTRVLDGNELAVRMKQLQERPASFVSDHHKAALGALRRLTGQDAAANRAAWTRIINVDD